MSSDAASMLIRLFADRRARRDREDAMAQQQAREESLLAEQRRNQGLNMLIKLAQDAPDVDVRRVGPPIARMFGNTLDDMLLVEELQKGSNAARKRATQREEQMAQAPALGQNLGGILATNPALANEAVQGLQLALTDADARSQALNLAAAYKPVGQTMAELKLPEQVANERAASRAAARQVETARAVANISDVEMLQAYGDAPNFTPALGRAAAAGKAFREPLTGRLVRGTDEGKNAIKARGTAELLSILANVYALSERFASDVGGNLGTTTLERARAEIGSGNPYFAALDAQRSQFELVLGQLRSGATLTKRQTEQIAAALPTDAEMAIENGKLSRAARARILSAQRFLESGVVPLFDPRERREAQRELRDSFGKLYLDAKQDPLLTEIGRPADPDAASALDNLLVPGGQ